MSELDLLKTVHIARSLVKESGDQLRQEWWMEKQTTTKDVRDVVTKYDRIIENRLVEKLSKMFPNHGIFGEEYESQTGEREYSWYIDPIDGTKYFAADIPLFTVSLGLVREKKPVLGVVYNPISHQMYWGYQGGGAWVNYEPIRVAKKRPVKKLVLYGDLAQFEKLEPEEASWVAGTYLDVARQVYRVRTFGCGSLGLAWVASGGFDGFIDFTGRTRFYDICAGLAILEAAGGMSAELEVGYKDKRMLGASNPATLKEIKKLLLAQDSLLFCG